MLDNLKRLTSMGKTLNGGTTYTTAGSDCLDLFFRAGAMRNNQPEEIKDAVLRAYSENPVITLRTIFYARDIRGGIGERRFFRIALSFLAEYAPEAVIRNIGLISEYGRFDDILVLLDTPCRDSALKLIRKQLAEDIAAMQSGQSVSLLAKWLPSVNASSGESRRLAKLIISALGITSAEYRKQLSALRKYIDIIENHLRETDYTFDYSSQPSRAMLKYRKAFFTHDEERYRQYLSRVISGNEKMNTSALFPYDITRACLDKKVNADERMSLDATWRSLTDFCGNENAIAVVDGSGSMYCGNAKNSVRPIDVALSLGIYFAEHSKGRFAKHFITFSHNPRLIEVKGADIYEKVNYCSTFSEVADTNLEAVFWLILLAAKGAPAEEMPSRIYIISDMEFNRCVFGGNNKPLFEQMKILYEEEGFKLPEIVFWNVNSWQANIPVSMSQTGAALISGASPALFNMVMSGNISPEKIMLDIINSERYQPIE